MTLICHSKSAFSILLDFWGDSPQFAPNSYLSGSQSLVLILESVPLLFESLVTADALGLTLFKLNLAQLDESRMIRGPSHIHCPGKWFWMLIIFTWSLFLCFALHWHDFPLPTSLMQISVPLIVFIKRLPVSSRSCLSSSLSPHYILNEVISDYQYVHFCIITHTSCNLVFSSIFLNKFYILE